MSRAAIVALFLCGCHGARTEMVVRISQSGLTIPDDVEALSLFVKDKTSGAQVFAVAPTPLCGSAPCLEMPTAITLFPGSMRPHDIVEVEVKALRNDTVVIDDAATFTFAEGRDQEMAFILFRSCLDTNCAANPDHRSCVAGGVCGDITPTPLSGDLRAPDDVDLGEPSASDLAGADLANLGDFAPPDDLATPHDLSLPPGTDLAGGPVFDYANKNANSSTNTLNWSHTVGNGANRILLVGVCLNGSSSINSVVWGIAPMNLLTSRTSGDLLLSVYYLLNPAAGTDQVSVGATGSNPALAAGSISLFNVGQQQAASHTAAGSNTMPQDTIASALGDLVVDAVISDGTAISLAEGAGQTSRVSISTGPTSSDCVLGMSTSPANASSTTMGWTLTANAPWEIAVTNLSP